MGQFLAPRITTASRSTLTLSASELVYDTDLGRFFGGDGSTVGGFAIGNIIGSGTANQLSYFTASGTITSLTTTTYPSLIELSYVKGVTSAIQTQLNSKQGTLTLTTTGSSGPATLVANTLNIPQYTGGGLLQYANFAAFPGTGSTTSEYLDLSTNITYYWNGSIYKKLDAFTADFQVSLPGGKTLGKYTSGSTVPANGLTAKEVLLLAAVEAIPPTLTLTSSTTIAFNQTAINNVLNFTKTINSLGASISTLSLEWRRNNTGSWVVLTTTTSLTTYTHSMTDSANNAQPFNYRLIVTDTVGGTNTVTLDITPSSYVAPTASLSLTTTPGITLNKMLRSLSSTTSVTISGTITRNTSLVNLSQYKIQRSYNNSTWTDLITLRAITASGGTLAANGGNIPDTAQPINQNNVYYKAFVSDTYITSGTQVNTAVSFGIYQPVLFGMTSATTPASVTLSSLTSVPVGASSTSGNCNYQNSSSDKTISGLSFTASTNRFCIAFDDSYGTLSSFFDTQSNLNLISNFTSSTQSVTFQDGTSKTYKVYLYNLVVSSGTYIINIS